MQDHPSRWEEITPVPSLVMQTAYIVGAIDESPSSDHTSGETPSAPSAVDLTQRELELARKEIKALQEERRALEKTIADLTLLTLTDDLTGLRNERRFQDDLESARTYAVRHNQLLSAIVLDLDDFGSFNETFGKSAGDQALCDVARLLTRGLRTYDVLARLSGGQFALLLPSTDRSDARRIAERLRKEIDEHCWPFRRVTASFGIATMETSAISSSQLVVQALKALIVAKTGGKNRVEHYFELANMTATGEEVILLNQRFSDLMNGSLG
jgi:diguanylate cyclase (GGDEF)-like protein